MLPALQLLLLKFVLFFLCFACSSCSDWQKFVYDDERQNELFKIFKKLDRDEDGHLEFKCVESEYLKGFNKIQKSFFYQVICISEMGWNFLRVLNFLSTTFRSIKPWVSQLSLALENSSYLCTLPISLERTWSRRRTGTRQSGLTWTTIGTILVWVTLRTMPKNSRPIL